MTTASHPLRVLHIIPSSSVGGGPEHVWQLVRHLPPHVASFIAAPRREPYWPRFMEAVGENRMIEIPQRSFSLRALWKVRSFLMSRDIRLIHSHGKGGGLYGRPLAVLSGRASVHTFHGIHAPYPFPLDRVYLAGERLLCAASRYCIAVSPGEKLLAESLGLGGDRLAVVYNGVEVPVCVTPHEEETFTIVHATRFDPVKNTPWLQHLAAALAACGLERFRIVIAGDGTSRVDMEHAIAKAGLARYFLFAGEQGSLREIVKGAGCYVSCSSREGLPLAVLEAQAEGVPAVVSDVTGNRDAIEDGVTGMAFPFDDAAAAAAAVLRLAKEPGLRQRMGQAAHARALELFDVRTMAETTAALYGRALGAVAQ